MAPKKLKRKKSIKVLVTSDRLTDARAEAIILFHEEAGFLAKPENPALLEHMDAFEKDLQAGRSKREWFCTLAKDSGCHTRHLLLDSTTFGPWAPHDESLKETAARCIRLCRQYSLSKIAIGIHHELTDTKVEAIMEGIALGDFQDFRYKGKDVEEPEPLEIRLFVSAEDVEDVKGVVARVLIICEAQNYARELVNAPHHELTPSALAKEARRVAKEHNLKTTILDHKKLKEQKYMPTYEVGRGSEYPPCMMVLRYTPKKAKNAPHLALVGKGMTFDSGGLCIKTRDTMHRMNMDMGGAAAVLGAISAIAELKLPIKVTAIIASAHNAVDGAAFHPGSIITAKNGKTIYVENTDAEGRLILSDCLHRAGEEKADLIWDFATLTGAVIAALGPAYAGLFTDDEELRELFIEAGQNTGDQVWPLPLAKEYEPAIKHNLADLSNMGSDKRGSGIHAANFLKNFVPEGTRWAHIDIAGTAVANPERSYFRAGATGFGVRLTVEAIELLLEDRQ